MRDLLEKIPKKRRLDVLINEEIVKLANSYIDEKIVSIKHFNDCLHIAAVTVNKIDVLISWNFKHIVNLQKIRLYNSVNLKMGYQMIDIRTPIEIINEK